jgi:hypothetical protein
MPRVRFFEPDGNETDIELESANAKESAETFLRDDVMEDFIDIADYEIWSQEFYDLLRRRLKRSLIYRVPQDRGYPRNRDENLLAIDRLLRRFDVALSHERDINRFGHHRCRFTSANGVLFISLGKTTLALCKVFE